MARVKGVASPFARERGKVKAARSASCCLEVRTPYLNPLHLAKGRAETNAMGLTTSGHYRSRRIALKSYRRTRPRLAKIRAIQPATMKLPSTRVLNVVAASLRRGVQAALLPRTRRHSAMATALIIFAALIAAPIERAVGAAVSGQSGDPGWPREKYSNGNRLIIYQPQVDDWKNFQDLSWRMAVSITPKGGKTVLGVVEMKGNTNIDNVAKLVVISNPQVTGTYFPSFDNATKEKMDQLFKTFV